MDSSDAIEGFIHVGKGVLASAIISGTASDAGYTQRVGLILDRHALSGAQADSAGRYLSVMSYADLSTPSVALMHRSVDDAKNSLGALGMSGLAFHHEGGRSEELRPRMHQSLKVYRDRLSDDVSGVIGADRNAWSPKNAYEMSVAMSMTNPAIYRKTHQSIRSLLTAQMHGAVSPDTGEYVAPSGKLGIVVVGVEDFSNDRKDLLRDVVRLGHVRELRTIDERDERALKNIFANDRDVRPNIALRPLNVYTPAQIKQINHYVQDGKIAAWGPKGDGALAMIDILERAEQGRFPERRVDPTKFADTIHSLRGIAQTGRIAGQGDAR